MAQLETDVLAGCFRSGIHSIHGLHNGLNSWQNNPLLSKFKGFSGHMRACERLDVDADTAATVTVAQRGDPAQFAVIQLHMLATFHDS